MSKIKNYLAFMSFIVLVSCSSLSDHEALFGPTAQPDRVLTLAEVQQQAFVSFSKTVQPILDKRCVVCHACNDAPCQLNLASIDGLDRGASIEPVYNGGRIFSQLPTRLGIDAQNTPAWREKGFTPVLNERRQNEQINLDNSLLYKMLTMKRRHPLPTKGRLPAKYDIGTNLLQEESFVHEQDCPNPETFAKFEQAHPDWGMPFALPGLSRKEFKTIETWLEQGGRVSAVAELSAATINEITKWEQFFNGSTNKEKLVSRYIFEHIFAGHIYFDALPEIEFFQLVRSRTPPGEEIDLIPSIFPYDDPGVDNFYYRLKHYAASIVDKTHMPYALNDKRLSRYKELFLLPEYEVDQLPSYELKASANPFKTFVVIPPVSRYKFMLDEAHFFVSGFIKGPVCRGSIALSVIDDHFWVMFSDPDKSYLIKSSEFLMKVGEDLKLPTEKMNGASLLAVWSTYKDTARQYFLEKVKFARENYPEGNKYGLDTIWDGDQVNQNAALTVYRHYDSATVIKGFVGEVPKTGWVIDYPVFERIHYLLVAGFNVYGKVGLQLSARLYMDFLRMESEIMFLAYLPKEERLKIHAQWYPVTDATKKLTKLLMKVGGQALESNIEYKTKNVKQELFLKVSQHLGDAQPVVDYINLCSAHLGKCQARGLEKSATRIQNSLRRLGDMGGKITDVFPNVTFLRIKMDGSVENDKAYTILRNNYYKTITSLVPSEKHREKSKDTLDIVEGFVGAYPNFFLEIDISELDAFVDEFAKIDSYDKYEVLVSHYGIRRTNPNFWKSADWFYDKYKLENPVTAGIFDLNRYKNR